MFELNSLYFCSLEKKMFLIKSNRGGRIYSTHHTISFSYEKALLRRLKRNIIQVEHCDMIVQVHIIIAYFCALFYCEEKKSTRKYQK